jgi:TonB-linked SusC/RagA family outer membrane protein
MSVVLCLLFSLPIQAKETSNTKHSSINHQTQQEKTITGVVTDKNTGETIIGANVVIKGTTNGVITDFDGKFSIHASENAIIQFSYIGYQTQEIAVKGKSIINVILGEDTQALAEVVVTAMGIERKSKSLTYATQQVGGKEFTRAKETNLINSLQGKTSGLVITPNASGAGGSSKVLLRGNKSAQGNNQPLIVIDGIPISNASSSQQSSEYDGRDGGDALSNINPDDIASMNILKGASAAALYGSMAANGVIIITTKKGREGTVRLDFSSNITMETPLVTPDLQSRYGAIKTGDQLDYKSWGEKITDAPGAHRVDDFFNTGASYINSISMNGGTKHSQSYLSYANTTSNGIMPGNTFQRHNMTVRQSFNLLEDKLTIDASINYINQKGKNRPHGGTYFNPLTGLYTFPANGDWDYYADNYEIYSPVNSRPEQQWYTSLNDFTQNPYWIANRNATSEKRNRTMASGTIKYKITDYLNVQGRLSLDTTNEFWDQKIWATTTPVLSDPQKGRYKMSTHESKQLYGDMLANFNKTFGKWEVSASVGASFMDYKTEHILFDAQKASALIIPNFFVPENASGNAIERTGPARKRLNSVFATTQIGYKEMLYLDITGRNDWSSTLAYTNNVSFFYPAFGLTAILNEMVTMPEQINLFKLRGSYSIVGNDMPAYITYPKAGVNFGTLEPVTGAPFSEMKPEKMHSMEFGFDLSMFDNKFHFDLTYYKSNNKNQYFKINAPIGSGYESFYVNTGNIQNQGFESSASYSFDFEKDWGWRTDFNISYNDNEIKELDPRLGKDGVEIGSGSGFDFRLTEGGSFGDIYTRHLLYNEDGSVKLNEKGLPEIDSKETYAGNVNAKWQLGWGNTFTYKDLSLYFLFDGKIGGNTVGMTQSHLDSFGVTEATAAARDNGGVDIGNGQKMDAQTYYETVAGKDKAGSEYVYSLTNFRLRELSLGYTFRNLLGVSKNLSVSLIGRNLFFLYKDSPHDPDMSMSTNNGYQGFDVFSLPATRSFGFNLKATF